MTFTRRSFLAMSAVAAPLAAAGCSNTNKEGDSMQTLANATSSSSAVPTADDVDPTPIVDTHAHVYPGAYLDRLIELGADAAAVEIARMPNSDNTAKDLGERLRMMDEAGVDIQVLSATPQSPLLPTPEAGAEASRMVNDLYREIVDAHPGRFACYGAIPFNHPDKAIEEIGYCLDELGFVGIAINAMLNDPQAVITQDVYRPIFEELNRRKAVLYIHPTGHAAHCPPMQNTELTWVNGAPVEDGIVTLQLLKANYPNIFPDIRFHIAHLGGDVPFLARRIQDNYEDWGSFESDPSKTLRQMWFDAANFSTGSLRLASEVYDTDKLLTGSDFPYFQEEKYTRAVSYIRETGLSPEITAAILSANAVALYDGRLTQSEA
ncbi:amidohydrolase family protein [Corynebacterium uterequi]|uniref:Putative TIM-barrel fold metal-dependent hydrolase n=1 Tax=Corynebacterium uterequi TaxID=1072256 RepID=A0A0G3HJ44_9CORY|nr:amidohydrolase family protein [Corynebacterium uterequi]AKK11122.1 putative TIM-barrel fold metal-dependent hydrolase [Corynebacterium uterequi]